MGVALWLNAAMFVIEIIGGFRADSVSLLADAADFLGDTANYGLSLAVLSLGLLWRARAAFVKGLTMGAFSLFVLVFCPVIYWHMSCMQSRYLWDGRYRDGDGATEG